MAKRASLTSGLSGLASQKIRGAAADNAKLVPVKGGSANLIEKVTEDAIEKAAKIGRPRTLPDGVKTLSVRVSDDVRKALRQASLDHDIPMQEIIMNGIMDQLAKLAR